jgi:hypothetical protein
VAKLVGSINLDQVIESTDFHRRRALIKALEHLLGAARQLAPIEEGHLERSGKATVLVEGQLGAVYFNTPYAVRQHEDLTYRHDPGRSAKYLEIPMTVEQAVMLAIMATELRKAFQ